MMWLTTMNPKTRRLIKVSPEDAAATEQMFALLLGDNLDGRKSYIAENGHRYLDDPGCFLIFPGKSHEIPSLLLYNISREKYFLRKYFLQNREMILEKFPGK